MRKLTETELAYLNRGIGYEEGHDFRLYAGEKHESRKLYDEYIKKTSHPELYDPIDIEIITICVMKRSHFWVYFFEMGEEFAMRMFNEVKAANEEEDERLIAEARARREKKEQEKILQEKKKQEEELAAKNG